SFWLVIVALILFIAYAVLIGRYKRGWEECSTFEGGNEFHPSKKVSVIIPARNEEKNISACLSSLKNQTYPASLLEILVVDDHSEDGTADVAKSFPMSNVRLIPLSDFVDGKLNSYKKKAIEVGISQATGDWIITTDADCTSGSEWIWQMMAFQEMKSAELIAGPVKLTARENLLEVFQALDFLTMQGITAAAAHRNLHTMCNGANLAYSKQAFLDVKGFENIDTIASGDDMLLMQKVNARFPGQTAYLKSVKAIVTSAPARTWKEFWQQRIRWSSKADKYGDKKIFRILLLVYFFNFSMLALFLLTLWNGAAILAALLLLLCKTVVEFPFVNSVAKFFGQQKLMYYFIFLQPFHLLYVVIAGFLGKFGKYEWKGRSVK
ncbi:MAG TPA: glycosyltransferase, partial [Chitinophagaceae bacterium]|nr:glycosyltransferase [Chitinophagaceae bacterium]